MKLSRSTMSLTDEWRHSSDSRRAAILRLGYSLCFLGSLPFWIGTFPELRPFVGTAFMPLALIVFNSSVPPLFSSTAQVEPIQEALPGSPNGRYVTQFFTTPAKWKDAGHWVRPFYRFSSYFLMLLFWAFGVFFAIFFAPLLAVECILWSRQR